MADTSRGVHPAKLGIFGRDAASAVQAATGARATARDHVGSQHHVLLLSDRAFI